MAKTQPKFSLLAAVALTTAGAIWFWYLGRLPGAWDLESPGRTALSIAIITGVAATAGAIGHVLYALWLPWRITVATTSLSLYVAAVLAWGALEQGPLALRDSFYFLFGALAAPVQAMFWEGWLSISLRCLATTVLFTPAHAIRPCLPAAIVTALGVMAWLLTGVYISGSAG